MKNLLLVGIAVAMAATAQTMPDMKENPIAASGARAYASIAGNITKSIDKMPADKFGYRATDDTRTFAQLVGHIANANYTYCGVVTGGKAPDNYEKNASTKEALAAGWKGANEECTKAWSTMTDKGLAEMKKMGQREVPAAQVMFGNISHTNEHYGNLVTMFRLNKMVPPSTEASQSMQKK